MRRRYFLTTLFLIMLQSITAKAEVHLTVNDTVIPNPSGATENILPGDRVYYNCSYATDLITYLYKRSITGDGGLIHEGTFNGTVWTTQVLTCCHHIKVWNCSLPTILNVQLQENETSNCSSTISPTPSLSLTMDSLLTSTEIEESSSYTIMATELTSYTEIANTESISYTESIEPISYTELASGYTESASSAVTVTECIMTSAPLPTPTTITILQTVFVEPTTTSITQYTFSKCFSNNSGIIALILTTFVIIILLIILGLILMVICCCCKNRNRRRQDKREKAGYHGDDNDNTSHEFH